MTELKSNRWDTLKSLMAVASVIVASLALWQSQVTAKKQEQIADQTLTLQTRVFQRSQSALHFGLIRIALNFHDRTAIYYPERTPGDLVAVPYPEWADARSRYVQFTVANQGTSTVYMDNVGVGVDDKSVAWAKQGYKWCRDRGADTFGWTDRCPRELPAAAEFLYSIQLERDILEDVRQDWQEGGFEVCVRVEAYGVSCQRGWATLPEDFLDPLN